MRVLVLSAALAGLFISEPASAADLFRDRVAPVLERSCVGCHRGVAARAGLSLDTRGGMLSGGDNGPAIDLESPDDSLLLGMVTGDDPAMPQDRERLSESEIASIREWIAAGAPWPDGPPLQDRADGKAWWSLTELTRPALPETAGGPEHPIDRFVAAAHAERGLNFAAEAPRAALLRRLTYDLHGLPPTPEEIAAFQSDASADAYEKAVDRLLASPRYGERWARHWLDVVHYGDTHGYDKDKPRRNAWPYRDYVVQAFNNDLPYARFIIEQLAGDALTADPQAGAVATGFVVAGPWDFVGHVELREGTVEKAKTRALDRDDMVASAMSTFQSLTVHCARCHDHAFDPIPQIDYYALQAVFAGVERADVPYASPEVAAERAKLAEANRANDAEIATIESQIASLASDELTALDRELARRSEAFAAIPDPFEMPEGAPVVSPTNGFHSAISQEQEVEKWVQVDLGETRPISAIRLFPARPTDFPDTPGFGFPVRFRVAIADREDFADARVMADRAASDVPNPGARVFEIQLAEAESARYVRVTATRLWPRTNDFVFALGEMQVESQGANAAAGAVVTASDTIEAGRWSTKHLTDGFDSRYPLPAIDASVAEQARRRAELAREIDQAKTARVELVERLMPNELREARDQARAERERLIERTKQLAEPPHVYGVKSIEPRTIQLLERGEVEKARQEVGPAGLSCLATLPAELEIENVADERARRLALARWIADPRNPLTWRSIVNRVWHYHFGRGLVDTPNDFGRNGSKPSHPELLDWLAVEFRDSGNSLKALHRLIVTSAAYKQGIRHDEKLAEIDAGNKYLWRMNRRRLEAEEIRDAMLAASGKLDFTMGGPGFELFEFKDDHSPRYDPIAPDRADVWRRSIYRFITRSVPNPWMESLDCPDPSQSAPVRGATITALQALAQLNDEFVFQQSGYLAERLSAEAADPNERARRAFLLCLNRQPGQRERERFVRFAEAQGWPAACRVLFNTNEFVFVD